MDAAAEENGSNYVQRHYGSDLLQLNMCGYYKPDINQYGAQTPGGQAVTA